jgi:hypothetical protein
LIAGSARPEGQILDPVEIRVVDEIGKVVAFEGQLLPNSTISVSLCPDREHRAQVTICAAAGHAHHHFDLLGPNVYLPMR